MKKKSYNIEKSGQCYQCYKTFLSQTKRSNKLKVLLLTQSFYIGLIFEDKTRDLREANTLAS